MIDYMYLGSGDTTDLLSGLHTKSHHELLKRFVSGVKPYYNAKASPIDALRTGAILEERYHLVLPDDYYPQYVCVSGEMDVFKSSLDFAKLHKGEVIDFDELKSISMTDFLYFQEIKHDNDLLIGYVRKKYKNYFNQVQQQLFVTGLDSANLVFLIVYSYNDEENYKREILHNEYIKVRVSRDDDAISFIKERGMIFQNLKNLYGVKL